MSASMPSPMSTVIEHYQQKVLSQCEINPAMYGDIDFNQIPLRFTDDLNDRSMLAKAVEQSHRAKILSDKEQVDLTRAFTLLGDTVADAYIGLMPKYGFRPLINMLQQALQHGIESVEDAPQELKDFIGSMEEVPDWIDMDLVEQGARYSRINLSSAVPFAIRGAFLNTFSNTYSGLPMVVTGTLANESVVKRIQETSSFFTTATLPGSLTRFGPGFNAAAMVRLMHSTVRFHLIRDKEKWDYKTYGIPIPQIDQMPAGTMTTFNFALRASKIKRENFTPRERAIVELERYQCYLLGLPKELLPATPREVLKVSSTYGATLRSGFDENVGGKLVKATLNAYIPKDKSLRSRLKNQFEKSFSKVVFVNVFCARDRSLPKKMNISAEPLDYCLATLVGAMVGTQVGFHSLAEKIPGLDQWADKLLVKKIDKLLVEFGHAEYTSESKDYSR